MTDHIWVGKMNMARQRVKRNTEGDFPMEKIEELEAWQSDDEILRLYHSFKDNPKVQWKESIKKVITAHGLDCAP